MLKNLKKIDQIDMILSLCFTLTRMIKITIKDNVYKFIVLWF